MAARVFLPNIAEADMNGVYAIVCKAVLPAGMVGMVIAAMFSATMSSLAGNFNAVAAVIVNELYLKLDRGASAARRMVAARLATIVTGGAVVALTFVMQYAQGADDLFNLSNKVFGVFLPPIAIPMLAGIFVRRLSKRSGMVALVGGIAVGLAVFIVGGVKEYSFLREMIWVFPITATATVLLLGVATFFMPDRAEERKEVDAFFNRIAQCDKKEG
jgi:Na+/proline symporter